MTRGKRTAQFIRGRCWEVALSFVGTGVGTQLTGPFVFFFEMGFAKLPMLDLNS